MPLNWLLNKDTAVLMKPDGVLESIPLISHELRDVQKAPVKTGMK